ncbi:MAG: GNAT family N-acetyltransferase [bacterium]
MQNRAITVRKLKEWEIDSLIQEIDKFPQPAYISKDRWKGFDCIYTVALDNNLAGVCVVIYLGTWIKLGPLIVFEKYQGKGLSTLLLNRITEDFKDKNIYIGSFNPRVGKVAEKLGFMKLSQNDFMHLPKEIKLYHIKYWLECINFNILSALIKKRFRFKDGNAYSFYLKYRQES